MFETLQGRLVSELRLAGLTEIEAANRWLRDVYLPDHNAELTYPPALPESGFVAVERARLVETLCIEEERTVGRDNTIAWEGRRLQIPESPLRRHYVKARVKVHLYPDGHLAILHGLRVIARYTGTGEPIVEPRPNAHEPVGTGQPKAQQAIPAAPRVAPRSVPSSRGLEAGAPDAEPARRPALTAPRRGAKKLPCRKAKRCAA